MTSPFYAKVLGVASKYVDAQKASDILQRQASKCGADSASFGREDLVKVHKTLIGAIQLYLTDKDLCYKVADEVQALI